MIIGAVKSDVLYVKFKEDSVFTVSRERVDAMAQHFQQDATFVTHFALARLFEDIKNGKYATAADIPVAESWLSAEASDAVRLDVKQRFGTPAESQFKLDPALDLLLNED